MYYFFNDVEILNFIPFAFKKIKVELYAREPEQKKRYCRQKQPLFIWET